MPKTRTTSLLRCVGKTLAMVRQTEHHLALHWHDGTVLVLGAGPVGIAGELLGLEGFKLGLTTAEEQAEIQREETKSRWRKQEEMERNLVKSLKTKVEN